MIQDKDFTKEFLDIQMDSSLETKESLAAWASHAAISLEYEIIQASPHARPNHIGDKYLFAFCDQFKYGLTLPLSQEVIDVCHHYRVIPTMLTPNSFSLILGIKAMMEEAGPGWDVICLLVVCADEERSELPVCLLHSQAQDLLQDCPHAVRLDELEEALLHGEKERGVGNPPEARSHSGRLAEGDEELHSEGCLGMAGWEEVQD